MIRAPESALGASGKCPKCASFFTLAPDTTGAELATHTQARSPRLQAVPRRASSQACSDDLPELARASMESLETEESPATPLPSPANACPVPVADPGDGLGLKRRWLDPVGVVALLLCGVALLCASALGLPRLVLPLGATGLLTGLAALFLAWTSQKSRLLVPAASTVLGCFVVGAAACYPPLLGPTYEASGGRILIDPAAIRPVPLPGKANGGPIIDAEWADASRAVLMQSGVRVQVVKASVGPLPGAIAKDKKQKVEHYLLVRLQIHRVDDPGAFAQDARAKPATSGYKPQSVVTDPAGKQYRSLDVPALGAIQAIKKSSVFPVTNIEEVLAFDPPPAGVAYLRLEMQGTSAADGVFRFVIPGKMIEAQTNGRPAPRPR
jgi:hypothetical protein